MPTIIAESGDEYLKLVKSIEDNNTKLLESSIKYEQAKTLTKILASRLSFALDEFEGEWDNDEQCHSVEHAEWYIETAEIMKRAFGRDDGGRVHAVQQWVNNYLPFDLRKP